LTGFANAKDCIANLKLRDAFADGADHAGKISVQDRWKLRMFILADAHLPTGAVDAGGNHIDDYPARPGDGVRQIVVLQDFGPAILFNESSLHRVLASAIRGGWVDCQAEHSPNGTPSLRSGSGRILKVSATEHL
jgi:hypothetical protein